MACSCYYGMNLGADARDDEPCEECSQGHAARARIYNSENGLDPWHPDYMEEDE